MLFQPRHLPTLTMRLRLALWPRRSFARSARYAGLRLVRLGGATDALARGAAVGVFVATLPLPGLQLALAGGLAWLLRGNVPAALLATFWANPLTLPLLWLGSHWLGQILLGTAGGLPHDVLAALARVATLTTPNGSGFAGVYATLQPILKPLAVGGLVLGGISALAAYAITGRVVDRHRARRMHRPIDHGAGHVLPVFELARRPA